MDTALPPPPPLSEYPGIPGILGRSWDHPRMDTAHPPPPPPCLSILGFLGYSDDPGIIPGWTQLIPPCLSILGFLGYSDDLRIIQGWIQLTPPCLSILGFLGNSDDPRIIPGWTQSLRCPIILRLVVRVGVWYICTECGNISFLINQLDFNCCKQ